MNSYSTIFDIDIMICCLPLYSRRKRAAPSFPASISCFFFTYLVTTCLLTRPYFLVVQPILHSLNGLNCPWTFPILSLNDALPYFTYIETGGVGRSPTTDSRENSQENREVDLPVGTLEKMKDLMISIEKAAAMLETGLRSGDIYSTNAEDYLDIDLKNSANNDENNLDQ